MSALQEVQQAGEVQGDEVVEEVGMGVGARGTVWRFQQTVVRLIWWY